jgi:hypothetical protein
MALVIALGGTAVAATNNKAADAATKKKKSHTLTSSQVKKLADAEIKKLAPNLTVSKADSATTAGTANTANSAKIATNVLSANVAADGTMIGSIPAGATSSKTSLGTYNVNFGRSITGCTIAAAAANNTGPHVAFTAVGVADANNLTVFTRDPTNTVNDSPFYIQAICPG